MKKGTLIAIGCAIVAVFIAVVVLVIYGIYQSGVLSTVAGRLFGSMGAEQSTSVVFEYPADADTEQIINILRRRADSVGIIEADFAVGEDGTIIMRAPNLSEEDFESIADTFTATGQLAFCDSNGDVVLSGEDIERAAYRFGSVSSPEMAGGALCGNCIYAAGHAEVFRGIRKSGRHGAGRRKLYHD